MASPAGKVIGFLNGKGELDAFVGAVCAAGSSAAKISVLYGHEGIQLLEQLKHDQFFFGDSEDSVIQLSIQELRKGHYVAAVDAADHQQAEQIVSLALPLGGHGFRYFGTWVSEALSK